MRFFDKKKTISSFAADMKPIADLQPGETVVIETHDCYGGQIDSEDILRPDISLERMNQATGPFRVEGVRPGDILTLQVEKMELDPYGIMVMSPGLGVLGEKVTAPTTRLLPVEDGRVKLTEALSFPVRPMIGVIGVAPSAGEFHCAVPGRHGGNMDTKDITQGSKLYFPAFQEGGLFALGDLHAAMGDGEMNGTGVEIGGRTTVKADFIRNEKLPAPVVETSDSFLFISSAPTLDDAIRQCALYVTDHLEQELKICFQESYRLLSMLCDVKISQVVNKLVTVRIAVPKTVLPSLFR